jgi:4a-hydroxytetrahydrobiopterin dehydratase
MSIPPKNVLAVSSCRAYPEGTPPLNDGEIAALLGHVAGWTREGSKLSREYAFSTYMSGVRWFERVAEISEREDHHPDVHISWGRVKVVYWTHTVGGLSLNDFILAVKLDEAWSIFEKGGR